MNMTPHTPDEQTFLDAYRAMDPVKALIFRDGIRALDAGQMTKDQFGAWVLETFARYDAGEDLTLDDLVFTPPPAEGSGSWA